jgi:predicted nucleic acid-binding protein
MPPNRVLIDTSYFVSLNDPSDKWHEKAVNFATRKNDKLIVPEVVLTEIAYMLQEHVSELALFQFWTSLDSPLVELQSISKDDLRRAKQIRLTYLDAQFDFVDCCIMALSESLNITQVCTFDRRDFSQFTPSHFGYLELLP